MHQTHRVDAKSHGCINVRSGEHGAETNSSCAIIAGCATVAEVRKRGDDFWSEFEFYLSDLVVGCVLDCVLVGLLAPSAVIGAKPKTKPSGKQLLSLGNKRSASKQA